MKSYTVSRLVLIYLILALITLFIWNKRNAYPITGDEPHYLVMTQGFIRDQTLEQTQPYKTEFQIRKILKGGLAAHDADPSPANTHAVWGPHGLFNLHNIGLPLLLTIPFYLGGVLGAKVFLILCSSFILITAWQVSARFNTYLPQRWMAIFLLVAGAVPHPLFERLLNLFKLPQRL